MTLPFKMNDLVDAATEWCLVSGVAHGNAARLLAADRKGPIETRKVSDECSKIMEDLEAKFVVMRKNAYEFEDIVRQTPFKDLYRIASDRRSHMNFCFAALRFVIASIEFSLDPTNMSSKGPQSPSCRRYFDTRDELERLHKGL